MIEIAQLKVEHYNVPIGIGEATPRLSWAFSEGADYWTQIAYEITIEVSGIC
jgi:alpha-L-rhamnosidase